MRSTGREAGWTDQQWVGSTWQNCDFVLSQSTTGQGPFNEFLWSGQPAETIFTLMLWPMAKLASKPAVAKGGRGAAGANSTGKGGWSRRSSRGKEAPLPLPMSPAQGTDLPLSLSSFALIGVSLLAAGWLEQLSLEVGCPQCPPGWESSPTASRALGGALSGTKHSNCLTI